MRFWMTSTSRCKSGPALGSQPANGLAFHRPAEWLRHHGVEIGDEIPRSSAGDAAFDVKLPRRRSLRTRIENQISIWLMLEACLGVIWKVIRCLVSRRKASRVAIDWRMPDFPFSPKVFTIDAAEVGNEPDDAFGHVGVEVVGSDHFPPCRQAPPR